MIYVSLIAEALRARPRHVFWAVAAFQGALWLLVPALFYTSPPGDLPAVIAVGREFAAGSWLGPPLAPWLAALAFKLAGIIGVYVLAQVCVVGAYWTVFALGRSIVGERPAVLAVMLTTGVFALSAPTPEFGPSVLALPWVGFALLCFWQAVGEGRRRAWIGFGLALGLLLLTSYWGMLFAGLFAYFMLLVPQGRAAARRFEPWAAYAVALLLAMPHVLWLRRNGIPSELVAPLAPAALPAHLIQWPLLLAALIVAHAGLAALTAAGAGWRADRRVEVPQVDGKAPSAFARRFVLFFAFTLPLIGTLAVALLARRIAFPVTGPLLLLSGLAVMTVAKTPLRLYRQDRLGTLWFAIVLAPPVLTIVVLVLGPWTGFFDPSSRQPAAAMAQFFTDTYRRRTGQPLPIVGGETRARFVIAAASPDHPRVYGASDAEGTGGPSVQTVRERGAILVWPVEDPTGQPPKSIRTQFPDVVAELPQTFERPIEGFLPSLRLGWGLIRPQPSAPPSGAARPAGSK